MCEDNNKEKMSKLAREILTLSRNQLLVNLRFMDMALSRLEPMGTDEYPLATDGKSLFYKPESILRRYKENYRIPVRDYLHIILHCVFQHMFVHTLIDQKIWNLACDIAVEYTITGLALSATDVSKEEEQLMQICR